MRLLATLLLIAHATHATRVLELSDKFLALRNEGSWLLMFYAPWCGHCKKLEPTFQLVAQSLHEYRDFLHVGKVDCTRFTNVASHFEIKGYPTVIFLKEGRRFVFEGDRTRDELVAFVDRLIGPAVKSSDNLGDLVKKRDVFFLYVTNNDPNNDLNNNNDDDDHVSSPPSTLLGAFNEVATANQKEDFFFMLNLSQAKELLPEAETDSVWVFKDGQGVRFSTEESDRALAMSSESSLSASLSSFVSKERFPRFMKLTGGKLSKALSSSRYLVLAVLEEDILGELENESMVYFKHFISSFAILESSERQFCKDFQFAWTGTPVLANSIAMETLELPFLLVINGSTLQHHIPDDDPLKLTHEALHLFLKDVQQGTAPAYGGNTYGVRVYRALYEARSSLQAMWKGNPVLTAVLLGLPTGFFALICYSICCADIMDAEDDDEDDEDDDEPHQHQHDHKHQKTE